MACAIIVGSDRYVADFLRFELDGLFSDFRWEADIGRVTPGDMYFIDLDTSFVKEAPAATVFTFSRRGTADFPLPVALGRVRAAVLRTYEATPTLALSKDGHTATLNGRAIRLSEGEFALLSRLYLAKGESVGREELLADVFGHATDAGILNVYIHYLRRKLETGDEKMIFSSRGGGYRLSERLFGGKPEKDQTP